VAADAFWKRRAGLEWGSRTAEELSKEANKDGRCGRIGLKTSTELFSATGYVAPIDEPPSWQRYRSSVLEAKPLTYFDISVPADASLWPPWDIGLPGVDAPPSPELAVAAPRWVFGGCPDVLAGWRSSAILHLVACGAAWHTHERPYTTRKAYMLNHAAWHIFPKQPGMRFMTSSPELVAAELARLGNSKAAAAAIVRRIMAAAAADDRIAVLPAFDCASPWIGHAPDARLNVSDASIIVYRDACYPAVGGHACGSEHVMGGYELHALRPPKADVVTLHDWDSAPTRGTASEVEARIAARATACFYYDKPELEG